MKTLARVLRTSVARAIVAMCAAAFVTTASPAHAGMNVWTSHGPPGGGVCALAIDPITSNSTPRTLYAGTPLEGVFKSTDGGATWGAANAGLINAGVAALTIDPSTPSTLYAVGGDDVFSDVFKSTDAGATWKATNAGMTGGGGSVAGAALAIDPSAPQILYAATSNGPDVFKSTDAGATWGATKAGITNTAGISALAIDPTTPQALYAGTGGGGFKSMDAGVTWGVANAGLTNALAIDPTTPQTLYAGTGACPLPIGCFGGVSKSPDGGATWSAVNAGLPDTPVYALAIDLSTPQTLYAGNEQGVFKSTDGGSTWNALNAGLNTAVVALAIDPMEPRRVYAGTYLGGVFAIEQVPPSCVGDCAGADTVAIDDLVTLVNIALGTTTPSACPNGGLPLGGEVDVAVIIQAVTDALHGCGGGA